MNDLKEQFLQLLGLAKRASRAELGEDGVSGAVASGKARLVLLASDAAENSVRRVHYMMEESHAVVISVPFTKAELGGSCGRGSCAMMAITESGLALSAAKKLALFSPGKYDDAVKTLEAKDKHVSARAAAPKSVPVNNYVNYTLEVALFGYFKYDKIKSRYMILQRVLIFRLRTL